jgi:hypothetical protein
MFPKDFKKWIKKLIIPPFCLDIAVIFVFVFGIFVSYLFYKFCFIPFLNRANVA